MIKKLQSDKLEPFWYAVGTLFTVPILVIVLLILCVIFLCIWPIIPILAYYQRKEELNNDYIQ